MTDEQHQWMSEFESDFANSHSEGQRSSELPVATDVSKSWVEDFLPEKELVEESNHDSLSESYTQDEFWKKLEAEWKREAQEQDWLTDFEQQTPRDAYEFIEENPFREHQSCLEEGKRKLAQGKAYSCFFGCTTRDSQKLEYRRISQVLESS